jgi:hypothetical protein
MYIVWLLKNTDGNEDDDFTMCLRLDVIRPLNRVELQNVDRLVLVLFTHPVYSAGQGACLGISDCNATINKEVGGSWVDVHLILVKEVHAYMEAEGEEGATQDESDPSVGGGRRAYRGSVSVSDQT